MIQGTVLGDRAVVARFGRVAPAVQAELVVTMQRLAIRLQGIVKADKLSGQVLQNRTGQLRASIAQRVVTTGEHIEGVVGVFRGPTVRYGRAHEYGFSGVVNVKAHGRTITQAFGRPIAPTRVQVAAHTAQRNLRARSFLRSALAEFEPQARAGWRNAVRAGVAKA